MHIPPERRIERGSPRPVGRCVLIARSTSPTSRHAMATTGGATNMPPQPLPVYSPTEDHPARVTSWSRPLRAVRPPVPLSAAKAERPEATRAIAGRDTGRPHGSTHCGRPPTTLWRLIPRAVELGASRRPRRAGRTFSAPAASGSRGSPGAATPASGTRTPAAARSGSGQATPGATAPTTIFASRGMNGDCAGTGPVTISTGSP